METVSGLTFQQSLHGDSVRSHIPTIPAWRQCQVSHSNNPCARNRKSNLNALFLSQTGATTDEGDFVRSASLPLTGRDS